jgi:uncharacterized protein (DUF433 family)
MASGHSPEEILKAYPYLELADIYEALVTQHGVLKKLKFQLLQHEDLAGHELVA